MVSICPSMFYMHYVTLFLHTWREGIDHLQIGSRLGNSRNSSLISGRSGTCPAGTPCSVISSGTGIFFVICKKKKRYALTNAARYYMNSYCALPCELWVHVCSGKKPSTVPQHIPNSRLSPEGGISFSRTQLSFSGSPCNGTCLLSSPGLPVHLPNSPGKGMEEIRNAMGHVT